MENICLITRWLKLFRGRVGVWSKTDSVSYFDDYTAMR
jgi:hypothetical protein